MLTIESKRTYVSKHRSKINNILKKLSDTFTALQLKWDAEKTTTQTTLQFLCLNCNIPTKKLFQQIWVTLKNNGKIDYYKFFACETCKLLSMGDGIYRESKEIRLEKYCIKYGILRTDLHISNESVEFTCQVDDCTEKGVRGLRSFLNKNSSPPYCDYHRKVWHNQKINEKKRIDNQSTFDQYNQQLEEISKKFPEAQLNWDPKSIQCQSVLSYRCINPRCKEKCTKLFQHLHQGGDVDIFLNCDVCKFYVSEFKSMTSGDKLFIDIINIDNIIDPPKFVNFLTTKYSYSLTIKCPDGKKCPKCEKEHLTDIRPCRHNDFKYSCRICRNGNDCPCMENDPGFICSTCNVYFPDRDSYSYSPTTCKICNSKKYDDDIKKILQKLIWACQTSDSKKGRIVDKNNQLTILYLEELFYNDDGLLASISRKLMQLKTGHADWILSIDRLDNSKPHQKGNVRIVCIEFNTASTTFQNVENIHTFCREYRDFQTILSREECLNAQRQYEEALVRPKGNYPSKRRTLKDVRVNEQEKTCICGKCNIKKTFNDYTDSGLKKYVCKECQTDIDKARYNKKGDDSKKDEIIPKIQNSVMDTFRNMDNKTCLCKYCEVWKPFTDYSKHGLGACTCRNCQSRLNKERRNSTLREKISDLISTSRSMIPKRNKSKFRKNNPIEFSLTFETLLEIWRKQNGRCYYSNRPMTLKDEWMMSLERRDTKYGYTKDNSVLICREFNSTDHSIKKLDYDDRNGSGGWNKEKVQLFVDTYKLISLKVE
jgi:hypothetical protein